MPSACLVHTSPAMLSLLLSEAPNAIGGSELQLYLLGCQLRDRGWNVSFIVGDAGQELSLRTDECFYVKKGYEQPNGLPRWKRLFTSLSQLRRSLVSIDADIYITRGLSGQAGAIRAFTKMMRRQFVIWCANDGDAQNGSLWASDLPLSERIPASYAVRTADALIVQTTHQQKLLKKHLRRNGVLIPNISPWEADTSFYQREGTVLWLGSIRPVKRPQLVLEIAEQMPHIPFVLGGGRMRGHEDLYECVVQRAEALQNVEFLGFVPFHETYPLFKDASIVLSTSVSEGFPNVFLQAWCTGTPVVATCDPDDVIKNHQIGYHCPDPAGVAEQVEKLYYSEKIRSEMAARAAEYVRENHSREKVVGAVDFLLRDLLENTRSSSKSHLLGV